LLKKDDRESGSVSQKLNTQGKLTTYLYLPDLPQMHEESVFKGMLAHEIAHAEKLHSLKILMLYQIRKQIRDEYYNRLFSVNLDKQKTYQEYDKQNKEIYRSMKQKEDLFDKSISKYCRSQEAEADRLPAACKNINVACNLENLFKLFTEENLTSRSKNHPTLEKRSAWAQRIFKLREAEERFEVGKKQAKLNSVMFDWYNLFS